MRKSRLLASAILTTAVLTTSQLTTVPAASAANFIPWAEQHYLANAANSAGVYIQVQQDGWNQRINLKLLDLASDGYQPRVQVDWLWPGSPDFWVTEGPWRNTGGYGSTAEFWTNVTPYSYYEGARIWVWNGSGAKTSLTIRTK